MFNVNKLWQVSTGKSKSNPVNIVAQRFLQVFHDHGVQTTQIPRLLPAIKLDDLKSEDALLAMLTHDVLNQTAHIFGIRVEWLEGVDDKIYSWLSCYKQPKLFFDYFATLNREVNDILGFPVRALSISRNLDPNDPRSQPLAIVLVEQIAWIGDERIDRYHVYRDGWEWSHLPARIQLKAMIRVVHNSLDTPVPLFIIKPNEMEQILEGELIPKRFIEGCQITSPSLEDYVLTSSESGVATETNEIPDVLKYIEQYKLEGLITVEPSQPCGPGESTPEPESSPEPFAPTSHTKKSGKRADNNRDLWEPVRAVAGALWAEDDSLSIAEVIIRIQKMSHLKASKLTASAIRKHIADLAPPNVRGKSGRKPNKLT
jgi:hypothetical protein